MLFVSPVENLGEEGAQGHEKLGMVKYPRNGPEVNRYGEALSELAWAREQAKNLGESYLFRGPGSSGRMDAIERQIRGFYPFPVEFNADSTTILKLRGAGIEVLVKGPGGFEETVSVPAGGSSKVTVREPGVVTLRVGKRTMVLVTEPYTN